MTIAIFHPGDMGAAVAACAVARGHRVVWASANRSAASHERATAAGLEDVGSLDCAVAVADVVMSICPPSNALEIAQAVAARKFTGTFLDANAISPAHSREIGSLVEQSGARYVDGGIVGLPPTPTRISRLYLCGAEAPAVAALFAGSQTEAIVMDQPIGAASALKMCYAAANKGETALLGIVRSLARYEGVDAALIDEWRHSQPGLAERSDNIARRAFKAWRWAGEMEEIAASFDDAGLPSGFLANAEIYRRLTDYKDTAAPPASDEVSARLRRPKLLQPK